jgi:hypothetical protein
MSKFFGSRKNGHSNKKDLEKNCTIEIAAALAAWRSGLRIRLRNKKTRVRIPPGRFLGKHSSAVVYKWT